MKKLFALLVALVGTLGLMTSCKPKTQTPEPTPEVTPTPTEPVISEDLQKAKEFVKSIYQASEGNVTANMDRAAKVPVNGKEFTISWAVTVKSGKTDAVSVAKAEDGSKYVVSVTYNNTITEEVKFTLTATITSSDNESVTLDFEYTIPVFQFNTVNQMLTEKDTDKVYLVEGVITAVNKDDGKDSFVLSDASGSIFCYEKTLDVKLGQKVQISGNYSENASYPQISKVSLVQVVSENNDVVAASGTPVVTTVEAINTAAKAEGITAAAMADQYKGKYLEVTGYIVRNSSGYYNLAVAADQPSCCNLYAAPSLNSKQFAGAKVVVRGFVRGVSVGNGVTIQAQSITLAPGESLPTGPSETFEEPALVTDKTLTDVINLDAADEMKYTYKVTGTVSKLGQKETDTSAGEYGNLWVTDGTTAILVYGATATASAIAFDETVGLYTYKNPKDFATNDLTKNIAVGDVLEMIVVRTSYKDTKQLNIVVLSAKPAHTHTPATDWSKDTTHHWHACGSCEELLDKAEHTWNEGEVTTAPTESAAGVKTFTCTVCAGTKTEAIAPLGHNHSAATEWLKDETYHWHACATCEEPVQLDKAEHTWNAGEITTEPTVTTDGVKTFTCTIEGCGQTKTEAVDKLPVPLPEGAVVPTVGTAYRMALIQGNLENKVLYITGAMDGFYYATTEDITAGCDVYLEETTGGYHMYAMVGTAKKYMNIIENGTYINVVFEDTASSVWTYNTEVNTVVTTTADTVYFLGTRTDKSYTTFSACKLSYRTTSFIAHFYNVPVPHEHDAATTWTYDETYHWHACSGCDELLDKTEHVWGEGVVTTEPTETEDGVRTFTCTCGATKTAVEPALGHTHAALTEWSKDETYHWHACSCGSEVEEAIFDKAEHAWNEGEVTTAATTFKEGVKTFTCTVEGCGQTKTEVVAKLNVELPEGAVVPVVGTAYKLGLIQGKKADGKVYYITGAMASTYYFGTTTTLADGCDVYLEETEGGYYAYAMISGAKKYINVVTSGNYTNSKYETTASSVWTYSTQLNTIVTTINEKEYFIGTKNTDTYTTLGPVYTDAFIAHFYNVPTDAEKVELDRLNVVDERKITDAITLEEKGKYGSTITWTVKEGNAISWNETDSKWDVTQPAAGSGDAIVVLTATLTLNDATATVDVTVTVEDLLTDAELVALDKEALEVPTTTTENLTLPTSGDNGSTITWTSSNETVITAEGVVARQAEDVIVTLTATIELNGVTDTVTFEVTVKAEGAVVEPQVVATFDFGANSTASHVDGSDLGASTSYTSGDYTLSLTSMSKVYGPAYDAKGNSCIKFGTSSKTGTLSFTVAEDVNKVIIYVAGYKNATSTKVNINNQEYTVTTASNNGEYTAIEIDTTSNKTVTFTTVTYRCMVNTIEFWA